MLKENVTSKQKRLNVQKKRNQKYLDWTDRYPDRVAIMDFQEVTVVSLIRN